MRSGAGRRVFLRWDCIGCPIIQKQYKGIVPALFQVETKLIVDHFVEFGI